MLNKMSKLHLRFNMNDGILKDDGLGVQEATGYPGFYTVPNFRAYAINKDAKLIRVKDGREIKPKKKVPTTDNPVDVYRYFTLVGKCGYKNILRHRAVIASLRGFDKDKTQVNHLNGIPGDDHIENLQWVTQSENMTHAYNSGLRDDFLQPIEAWNVNTGEIIKYSSVPEYVRLTDTPTGTIRKRLATDNAILYNGYRYRYIRDEWSTTPQHVLRERFVTNANEILVYDCRNHLVTKYTSAANAGAAYGLTSIAVSQACRVEHMSPFRGCFFRYNETFKSFPILTPEQDLLLKMQGYPTSFESGCALYDSAGTRVFIGTYSEAETFLNRPVAVIRNYIRTGRTLNGKYTGISINKQATY